MRKITFLLAFLAILSFTFGQRTYTGSKKMIPINLSRAVNDTLYPASFYTGTATIYTSAGGYVCGTNNYGDFAKAQQYNVSTG